MCYLLNATWTDRIFQLVREVKSQYSSVTFEEVVDIVLNSLIHHRILYEKYLSFFFLLFTKLDLFLSFKMKTHYETNVVNVLS